MRLLVGMVKLMEADLEVDAAKLMAHYSTRQYPDIAPNLDFFAKFYMDETCEYQSACGSLGFPLCNLYRS